MKLKRRNFLQLIIGAVTALFATKVVATEECTFGQKAFDFCKRNGMRPVFPKKINKVNPLFSDADGQWNGVTIVPPPQISRGVEGSLADWYRKTIDNDIKALRDLR